MKKTFNPAQWQQDITNSMITPHNNYNSTDAKYTATKDTYQKVEELVKIIETNATDVVPAYGDWRNVGFAFADEFGENGRELYHRISRFYTEYCSDSTNLQYNRCLKSKGHGITIGTFFYWCHRFGIVDKANNQGEQDQSYKNTKYASSHLHSQTHRNSIKIQPLVNEEKYDSKKYVNLNSSKPHAQLFSPTQQTFPGSIFTNLPPLLKKIVDVCTNDQERDLMLLGSLVTMGASLYNVSGNYDGKQIFPNLYLFVSAPASSGKGRLLHCRNLLLPLHEYLRKESSDLKNRYNREMKKQSDQKEKVNYISKPPEKLMFIPANTSATGMFQLLADNPQGGLIFETEGDTLTQTFKSDYGNYSDGFRKAFHHEPISFFRRTDRELVSIEKPRLSAILSGTPNQVATLIPNNENGLYSRFIFYAMDANQNWKDVFAQPHGNNLDKYYLEVGNEWLDNQELLQMYEPITFTYSKTQQAYFNQYLQSVQESVWKENGASILPSIRRMGIITFRISMILSAIRLEGEVPAKTTFQCEDKDFQIALSMVNTLLNHVIKVNKQIIHNPHQLKKRKYVFWDQLPVNFNRQQYIEIAEELNIPAKTAERYIAEALKIRTISREKRDKYNKNP